MENFTTFEILKFLLNNWKKLLPVGCIAMVFSIIISSPLVTKPNYKSEFILYPTNLSSFSKESSSEQLFQFLGSEQIKQNLAKKFNLYRHYEIDSTDKKAQEKYNKQYNSNIDLKFTKYQSIEGSVIDESPQFAQQLANGIIKEVNDIIRKEKKDKTKEYIELYTRELQAKKHEIDSIENKLKFMRINYGLLDIGPQSKILSKKLVKKELTSADKLLLDNIKEHGDDFIILQTRFYNELESCKSLKQSYDKNIIDFNAHLSYATVVSYPTFPDKKNAPHCSLIVIFITLSSLLLASFILVITRKKLLRTK